MTPHTNRAENFPKVMLFVVVFLLAFHAPVGAQPFTFDFAGTMTSGTAIGSFSYDTSQAATLENAGGLANYIYQPSSWSFQVTSTFLPSQTFGSSILGQTGRICVGICTLGSPQQLRLDFLDGTGLTFTTRFALTEPVTALPTPTQIGGFVSGDYRDQRFEGTTRFAGVTSGALTGIASSVSEPETFWFVIAGFGVVIWGYAFWKEVNRR